MIYTNDLPASILSLETEQRFTQLGCAVTADRNTYASADRMPRRGKPKQSASSGGGRVFAIALNKAQSKD